MNDKHTKPLPDPFPFPDNYSPEITVALNNKLMPPDTLEKFITAVGRAVFALKCYPTSKELERVAIQATEKWVFLRAPHMYVATIVSVIPRPLSAFFTSRKKMREGLGSEVTLTNFGKIPLH